MEQDRTRRVRLVLEAITAVGTLGLLVSILMAYYGIRQDHEWKRRQYTVDLIGGFEMRIDRYRGTITRVFPAVYRMKKRGMLTPEQAESIWLNEFNEKQLGSLQIKCAHELLEVRSHVIGLLNYLEYLCQAYQQTIVDSAAFDESLGGAIELYHDYFEELIRASQPQLGYGNWQPINDYVWKMKMRKADNAKAQRAATGK